MGSIRNEHFSKCSTGFDKINKLDDFMLTIGHSELIWQNLIMERLVSFCRGKAVREHVFKTGCAKKKTLTFRIMLVGFLFPSVLSDSVPNIKILLPVFSEALATLFVSRKIPQGLVRRSFMLSTQMQIETLNMVLRPPPEKFERKIKALSVADARPPIGPLQLEQNLSFPTTSACSDYDSILLMLMETTVIPDS